MYAVSEKANSVQDWDSSVAIFCRLFAVWCVNVQNSQQSIDLDEVSVLL